MSGTKIAVMAALADRRRGRRATRKEMRRVSDSDDDEELGQWQEGNEVEEENSDGREEG